MILHICSDYPFTPVYRELLCHLPDEEKSQTLMYVPVRKNHPLNTMHELGEDPVRVLISKDYRNIDRIAYHKKRIKILCAIQQQVNLDKVDLIHAHYLFSAGGVAFSIKEKRDINYLVTVRGTDINVFLRYMIHLRNYGLEILRAASVVVFLSPAHMKLVMNKYVPSKFRNEIEKKVVVIPSGINDYWFNNSSTVKKRTLGEEILFLYIGEISKNKNIINSIRALELLRGRGKNVRFKIVGDGSYKKLVMKYANGKEWINIIPWTTSKEDLRKHYQSSDVFIMPSYWETFGLVFLEAMSQGLPVIYTSGQGIDGYWVSGEVGYPCNPKSIGDIASKAETIIDHYSEISSRCINAAKMSQWSNISMKYHSYYEMFKKRAV